MTDRSAIRIIDVSDGAELQRLCSEWRQREALALDTEFVRERTYFPIPGLVQASDGETCWLVDPVAIEDLDPLFDLLAAPEPIKVMHSASQDLELLRHMGAAPPESLFDTQIAASLAGVADFPGYANLVSELLSVKLDKGETRSDWTRRPLTDSQRHYAAQDVAHLLPVWRLLRDRLKENDRLGWLEEECRRLVTTAWQDDPAAGIQRQKQAWRMAPREQAMLASLWAWRERQARELDRPRNRVLDNAGLNELVHAAPRTPKALAEAGRTPGWIRRFGETVLAEMDAVLSAPDEDHEPRFAPPPQSPAEKARLKAMRAALNELAEETGIPVSLLATRQTLNDLATGASSLDPAPEELRGWRESTVVPALVEALEHAPVNDAEG